MRIRSQGLVLLAGLSILAAACGPAAQSAAPSVAPSAPASTEPSVAASAPPSAGAGAELKIGVVTDVGTVNDKNFNEYTYIGAQQGQDAPGVSGGGCEARVPGHGRDREDLEFGPERGQRDGQRVVVARVAVEDDRPRGGHRRSQRVHGRSVACQMLAGRCWRRYDARQRSALSG